MWFYSVWDVPPAAGLQEGATFVGTSPFVDSEAVDTKVSGAVPGQRTCVLYVCMSLSLKRRCL